MSYGSKVVRLGSEDAAADGRFYQQRPNDFHDYSFDATRLAVGKAGALEMESHSDRISCFVAELDAIVKRACEAARKGAEDADRMEAQRLNELAALRGQMMEKDESLLGLELALGHMQRASKKAIGEYQRLHCAQESQIGAQRLELQQLRSGRDYLTARIDEVQAAAKAAQCEAARIKERWQSEAVEHRLKVAEYEQWLSEKNLRLETLEKEMRTKIDELTFRLRQTDEKLANRDKSSQPKGKLSPVEFKSRVKKLDSPRATLQPTRKTQRAS
ncbi:MAG TPA: hypothetical protein VEB61_12390 [Candidatus Binatia bacterium]|nr:hypothetical protein [Candidatus Binatia bacterium]